MSVSWPGIVLACLLGGLLGGAVAFFTARSLKAVILLQLLGILGFLVGQLGQVLRPISWARVGTVDLVWGTLVAGLLLWWGQRHAPRP